jgi:cytochrome c5
MIRAFRFALAAGVMLLVLPSLARADKESPTALASANGAGLTDRQISLLTNNCVQCHARPNIGVPLMGNPPDWRERIKQGEDKLLVNVVHGLRGMPPLGYCSACDEADLRALIRVMAGSAEGAK